MNEEIDLIKGYAKRLEEEHRYFMEEYVKRPNKELDESLNNLSEEAQFLLVLMLLDNIVNKRRIEAEE